MPKRNDRPGLENDMRQMMRDARSNPQRMAELERLAAGPSPESEALRVTSVRGYRRVLDLALYLALRGRLSPGMLKEVTVSTREGAALLMTEKLLEAKGLVDVEPTHIAGPDGGVELPPQIEEYRTVTVERTTGISPTGQPVDSTTVTIEGGPALGAEVAALDIGTTDRHVATPLPEPDKPEGMAARLSRESVVGSGRTAIASVGDPFLDHGEVEIAAEPEDER